MTDTHGYHLKLSEAQMSIFRRGLVRSELAARYGDVSANPQPSCDGPDFYIPKMDMKVKVVDRRTDMDAGSLKQDLKTYRKHSDVVILMGYCDQFHEDVEDIGQIITFRHLVRYGLEKMRFSVEILDFIRSGKIILKKLRSHVGPKVKKTWSHADRRYKAALIGRLGEDIVRKELQRRYGNVKHEVPIQINGQWRKVDSFIPEISAFIEIKTGYKGKKSYLLKSLKKYEGFPIIVVLVGYCSRYKNEISKQYKTITCEELIDSGLRPCYRGTVYRYRETNSL